MDEGKVRKVKPAAEHPGIAIELLQSGAGTTRPCSPGRSRILVDLAMLQVKS
jgi:hypothetical protein